jgi:hypothetical protein
VEVREQLTASADHWSGHADGVPLTDVQFDAIIGELATIKRMLRSLLHG